jgi:hypothetical protein
MQIRVRRADQRIRGIRLEDVGAMRIARFTIFS